MPSFQLWERRRFVPKKKVPFEVNMAYISTGTDLYENEICSNKCHKLKILGYKFMIIYS